MDKMVENMKFKTTACRLINSWSFASTEEMLALTLEWGICGVSMF